MFFSVLLTRACSQDIRLGGHWESGFVTAFGWLSDSAAIIVRVDTLHSPQMYLFYELWHTERLEGVRDRDG
jgi:hypothetical protein